MGKEEGKTEEGVGRRRSKKEGLLLAHILLSGCASWPDDETQTGEEKDQFSARCEGTLISGGVAPRITVQAPVSFLGAAAIG